MKPNDIPKQTSEEYDDPKLYIVIGDEIFPRPGLETIFVDYTNVGTTAGTTKDVATRTTTGVQRSRNVTGGVYSSANNNTGVYSNSKDSSVVEEICICFYVRVASCGCVSHKQCSCVGYTQRTTTTTRCQCAPVH